MKTIEFKKFFTDDMYKFSLKKENSDELIFTGIISKIVDLIAYGSSKINNIEYLVERAIKECNGYEYTNIFIVIEKICESIIEKKISEIYEKEEFMRLIQDMTLEEYYNMVKKKSTGTYMEFKDMLEKEYQFSRKNTNIDKELIKKYYEDNNGECSFKMVLNYFEIDNKRNVKLFEDIKIRDLPISQIKKLLKNTKKIEILFRNFQHFMQQNDISNQDILELLRVKIKIIPFSDNISKIYFKIYSTYVNNILNILKEKIYLDENTYIETQGICKVRKNGYYEEMDYIIDIENNKVILKKATDELKFDCRKTILKRFFEKKKGKIYSKSEELKGYYIKNYELNDCIKVVPLINAYKKQKLFILKSQNKVCLEDNFYNLGDIFILKEKKNGYTIVYDSYGSSIKIKDIEPKSLKLGDIKNEQERNSFIVLEGYFKFNRKINFVNGSKKIRFRNKLIMLFYGDSIIPVRFYYATRNAKIQRIILLKDAVIQKISSNVINILIEVQVEEYSSERKYKKSKILRKTVLYYTKDYKYRGKELIVKNLTFKLSDLIGFY